MKKEAVLSDSDYSGLVIATSAAPSASITTKVITTNPRGRERGDGLVEFALILPVLMLILIAILDFGRAVFAYSVVANCAREGARFGTISPTDEAGIVAAATNAAVGLDAAQLTINVAHPTSNTVQVVVSYGFELITPLMAQVLGGNSLMLSSTATMYTGY